jgi:hypothetical protein
MVIFLPTETKEDYDFFNPPLTKPVPKEIKTDSSITGVYFCTKCDAYTVYVNTCAICQVKGDIQLMRFSGKYVIPKQ